jgi:hypothetical protein
LRELIEEGLRSGPPRPLTAKSVRDLRAKALSVRR